MSEASETKTQYRAVPPPDDPQKRHREANFDLTTGSADKSLAELRLAAIEHRNSMPASDEARSAKWVQMGPMAIPGGQTRSDKSILVSGRVTAIVVDPTDSNIIYVGAAQGGVWKTTNGGKAWVPTSDNEASLAIGALAMDPSDHLVLYAGTGEGNFAGDSYHGAGVLKTMDGGASWTLQGTDTFTRMRFCRIAVNPTTPSRIFAATDNGMYQSINGGPNWEHMKSEVLPTGVAATDVMIDPKTPNTVYAAFWGNGIYRTTNANDTPPTWTRLRYGLPYGGFTRIALGISPSSPKTLYALMASADGAYTIDQFYCTTDGGDSWRYITLPDGDLRAQGFYNLHVALDPTTPDIVYLSATSLWKAIRDPGTDTWTFTYIGGSIHSDHHALAFDPQNHQVLYAGTDGGIYTSKDEGMTWSDAINKGLCITQFEFMEQHPDSDAVVFAGTQDNGTEQYRNSPVFYHADNGDGGFVAIDHDHPNNILSTYYNLTPKRSTEGGKFGSWMDVSRGLSGHSLFYPPLALDASNPNNVAIGATRVFLDYAQGTAGWLTRVELPGLSAGEYASEINYVNSDLIYVGTSLGTVYRLTRMGYEWRATAISASPPLPSLYIWDIATLPSGANTIIVVMSGFDYPHVWRGTAPASGGGTWTWMDISGSGGAGELPNIPVNVVVIDSAQPNTFYIGTDTGVFRTTDAGKTWEPFGSGLPNCAIFDMSMHESTRLLRVATHGRGMWELQLDEQSQPDVNLFVRHNLMDTGRSPSTSVKNVTAAFEDLTQYVALGDQLWWWECADLKIDTQEGVPPAYQLDGTQVDYVTFERELQHRNPQWGQLNRVYAQVQNRGIELASQVTVKLLYTDACASLPDLPADFWKAFPDDSADSSHWKPIGPAQVIPSLSPHEPAVLEWDWNMPMAASEHVCWLMVTDCAIDPIPPENKVLNIADLISKEKRVGIKNLHVVSATPETLYWTPLHFFGNPTLSHTITIPPSKWSIGFLFQAETQKALKLDRVAATRPTDAMLEALTKKTGPDIGKYDTTVLYMLDKSTFSNEAHLANVTLLNGELSAMVLLIPLTRGRAAGKVSILQQTNQNIVGGSTFVLHTAI